MMATLQNIANILASDLCITLERSGDALSILFLFIVHGLTELLSRMLDVLRKEETLKHSCYEIISVIFVLVMISYQ